MRSLGAACRDVSLRGLAGKEADERDQGRMWGIRGMRKVCWPRDMHKGNRDRLFLSGMSGPALGQGQVSPGPREG